MSRLDLWKVQTKRAQIETEYQNAIATFRPKFGNALHLQIRDAIIVANDLQKHADQIIASERGGAKALQDALDAKRNLISMMKQ
jgi:hypothetical protein